MEEYKLLHILAIIFAFGYGWSVTSFIWMFSPVFLILTVFFSLKSLQVRLGKLPRQDACLMAGIIIGFMVILAFATNFIMRMWLA